MEKEMKVGTVDITTTKEENITIDEKIIEVGGTKKTEEDIQQDTTITDLVILQDDQPLTTSLKIAEVFGKQHKDVLRVIKNAISNGRNFAPVDVAFIAGTYKDAKGEERPIYYLNRDAFSFVVMGFTGEKATEWKWKYIQAFNTMEAQLKAQQKPMTQIEMVAALANQAVEAERKLREQGQKIAELKLDQAAIVVYSLRNVAELKNVDKEQQRQLDKHEEDIASIKKVFNTDIGPREEIKTIVELAVRTHKLTHQEAYNIVYAEIQKALGVNLGTRVNNIKKRLQKSGASKSKVDAVTKLDAIEQDPSLYKPVREVLEILREAATTVCKD